MIIALILAFLIGVFSVLLFEAFLLYKWWTSTERDARKLYPERTKVINPEFIADYFKKNSATEQESCMSLNFLLAFLWREWRDSSQMKSFFLQKMNSEFSELVKGKAASKIIEQITIDELSLGTSLPVIKGATVMKIGAKDPKEVPQELDIALDLEYSGGCHMAIQVDLVFNKSVYVAVKLAHLRGRARLQLSRHPLTHWSLAFYEEPEVEFQAESQFEGKNLPQLTSLITSHLRKSLQKKHTLPSYKIRYSPFFQELAPQDETVEVFVHDALVTVGTLEVTVVGCTRLPEFIENWAGQYCTLSVDLLPWSQLAENRRAMWPTFEVVISRETNDISFGLTLSKEISEDDNSKAIVVETIATGSPAYSAGVMPKDILITIDGHKIESLKQAAKMIKNKNRFTATVQRPPTRLTQQVDQEIPEKDHGKTVVDYKNVTLNNESESEDEFVNIVVPLFEEADSEIAKSAVREMLSTSTELRQKAQKKLKFKQGKTAPLGATNTKASAQGKSVIKDQVTGDQKISGLPSIQKNQGSPLLLRKTPDQVAQETEKKAGLPNATKSTPSGQEQVTSPTLTAVDGPDDVRTRLVSGSVEPAWNETKKFDVLKKDQYLNVCVWCKSQEKNEKDILLGYVTIPLMDIALRCLSLSSKRHEECYVLVSPHSDRIISNQPYLRNHPGLREKLCCGDITLIFLHTPSLVDCDEAILDEVDLLSESEPKDEIQGKDTLESLDPPKHQFILTQFYFPTRCSYCNKKVWTKVAFQCRICAMICHKKCLQNCTSYTHCVRAAKSTPSWFSRTPYKSDDDAKQEKEDEIEEGQKTTKESTAEGSKESELDHEANKQERSSDDDDKKQEGTRDETETGDELESGSNDQVVKEKEQAQTEKDERIKASDIARTTERIQEAGRELFSNLPLEARKNKLEDMMNKLQVEIDEENETRTDLYEQRSQAKDKRRKAIIESLLGKSEERSQALAMLMLQYCAGYQSCVEVEELDRYQL